MTIKQAVLEVLENFYEISNFQLCSEVRKTRLAMDGTILRRVRELRAEGHDIECLKKEVNREGKNHTVYFYRLN